MGRHGESPVPCMLQSADGPTKEFMEGTGRENELLNTLKKMIPTVGFEICVEFTFNSPNVPGLTIQAALSLTLNFDYGNSCFSWKGRLGVNVGTASNCSIFHSRLTSASLARWTSWRSL